MDNNRCCLESREIETLIYFGWEVKWDSCRSPRLQPSESAARLSSGQFFLQATAEYLESMPGDTACSALLLPCVTFQVDQTLHAKTYREEGRRKAEQLAVQTLKCGM